MPASPSTNSQKHKPGDGPVINEEADRVLGRLTLQTFFVPLVALVALTLTMPFVDARTSPLYRYHKLLDTLSTLPVLLVFYFLLGRLNEKRLEIGRALVAEREWKQAATTLEPFDAFGAKWSDRTGEAHYLLFQAYAGLKNKTKSEGCRQFVLKHRVGPWSAKLGGKAAADPRRAGGPAPPTQQKPRPPKSGPKRRF